jgi:predicted nucleic-acid-binding protein
MIGLDTNVLVRYLAQDDPIQSTKATRLIERRLTEADPGFVSVVTMAETVWVLDRAYGLADYDIATAIERILQTDVLVVESEQEVFTAMIALKEGRAAFADTLIAALGAKAGCSRTVTFDRKAARLPEFELLQLGRKLLAGSPIRSSR